MDWSTIFSVILLCCIASVVAALAFYIFGRDPLRAAQWMAAITLFIVLGSWWLNSKPTLISVAREEIATCRNDYIACASQEELVDTYQDMTEAHTSCKRAARKLSRYGDADLPFFSFESYFPYENSAKSGKISLIENNARFQNEFGAMEHVKLKCAYDLKTKKVLEIFASKK